MDTSFRTLSRWTVWANERLYDACGALTNDEYFLPRVCAFGSIHRTLNHLLATDRIWLGRLTGEGHSIPSLDTELCADFVSLRAARSAEDRRIVSLVDEIVANGDLEGDLHYTSMDGKPQILPRRLVLSHLFLHHAHHRGQVHALLSQTKVPPPALDLTYFPRAAE
ncbi:damage-inducible protein DinB [Labrys miyagiensis]|uniref:Damage-inducible protein DinB n=1 Tax=Labrys miyagiensis TaxID=346912 RepID=A0ABQ6CHT2_9HYPH|nr:DinB family protein [Labrys miyagiensis]GLS19192.1 damage-inducible protein DinB [Labrys miyagiensis]